MIASERSICRTPSFSGFTLVELLVVMLIIGLISVLALPTVLSSLSDRQVSEAARILQGGMVGARDSAIHNNAPSGIRLLPSPTFNGINAATGQLDPTLMLAADRFVPIEPAPDYTEGFVSILGPSALLSVPYPGPGGGSYPFYTPGSGVLMIEESVYATNPNPSVLIPNPPTSWFWNIRVGDEIQVNQTGPWFKVVGPMTVKPSDGNSEMFVNVGPPGPLNRQTSPLIRVYNGTLYYPEFLLLVNSRDDNANGWVDEGWDGVDNNGDGNIDELAEWETELWPETFVSQSTVNAPYRIRRRPAPVSGGRAISLPSNVVVDLTTWGTTRERSRLPVNPYTGYVEFLVNSGGDVVPSTIYSSPASFGMSSAFFHFWIAERSDVFNPGAGTAAPLLPLPAGAGSAPQDGRQIQGPYQLLTLFTRSGLLVTNPNAPFDNPTTPANGTAYNPNWPFLQAQQGAVGGF
jgi:prepilin-type N-terminal cleavage/methylation domain-containing protein